MTVLIARWLPLYHTVGGHHTVPRMSGDLDANKNHFRPEVTYALLKYAMTFRSCVVYMLFILFFWHVPEKLQMQSLRQTYKMTCKTLQDSPLQQHRCWMLSPMPKIVESQQTRKHHSFYTMIRQDGQASGIKCHLFHQTATQRFDLCFEQDPKVWTNS